jgi:hypothetical protein
MVAETRFPHLRCPRRDGLRHSQNLRIGIHKERLVPAKLQVILSILAENRDWMSHTSGIQWMRYRKRRLAGTVLIHPTTGFWVGKLGHHRLASAGFRTVAGVVAYSLRRVLRPSVSFFLLRWGSTKMRREAG